jgi:TetR/AcrR family transcriptional regulator
MDAEQAPVRRKDGRRERTAKAIKDAATALFCERGVQRTTVDDIADAADVSVGSVYVHFGSKDALYVALVEEASAMNAAYVSEAPYSDSALQRVFNAGDAYVRFATEHSMMFRLISMQGVQPTATAELAPEYQRIADRIEQRLIAIGADLGAAMNDGELEPMPIDLCVKYLWATWTSVIALTLRTDRLALTHDELRAVQLLTRNVLARGMGADIALEDLMSQDPLHLGIGVGQAVQAD